MFTELTGCGFVPYDQKFSWKQNFSFFKAVPPPDKLHFYLGSPLHRICSLFSNFCLFRKAILRNMLKLRFWNFKIIFLRVHFSLLATFFFSLVLLICLSLYFNLKLSREFLTLGSFNIWRYYFTSGVIYLTLWSQIVFQNA